MLAAGPLHHLWVRSFDTVEELRQALLDRLADLACYAA